MCREEPDLGFKMFSGLLVDVEYSQSSGFEASPFVFLFLLNLSKENNKCNTARHSLVGC